MKKVLGLDGVRAVAILLVLVDHSVSWFRGGGVGVGVFFVLSGYLITTLLLKEMDSTHTLNRGYFWARRALRLYPALFTMLVVTVILGAAVLPAVLAGTYTINIVETFTNNASRFVGDYGHTWSLSLEEQFYLLWPFLIPLCARNRALAAKWLAVAAVLSLIAVVLGTALLTTHGRGVGNWVFNPIFQAHGILIGCALAMMLQVRSLRIRSSGWVLFGGLAVVAIAAIGGSATVHHNWGAEWTFLAELGAAVVILGVLAEPADRSSWLGGILSCKVSVWIGQRSYGIYLWHLPLIIIIAAKLHTPNNKAAAIGVPLSFVVAWASYRWIETPFLRLKDRRWSVTAASARRSSSGELVPPDSP
jgi:peptidoglycan/LPS O-acetylase OafA/YrhL